MSLLPSLRIVFGDAMTADERETTVAKVRGIKGVVSVSFNGRAPASVTYVGGHDVQAKIRAVDPRLTLDTRHRF